MFLLVRQWRTTPSPLVLSLWKHSIRAHVPSMIRAALRQAQGERLLGGGCTLPPFALSLSKGGPRSPDTTDMAFWAYILRCNDGTCYTGHTDNLEARIAQHQHGQLPGYTRHRRPLVLMWSQDFPTRLEALEAERQIKGWTAARKEALIAGDFALLSRLARNRQGPGRPSTSSARTVLGDRDAPYSFPTESNS